MSTPESSPVLVLTTVSKDLTKKYPPLDVRSTVSDPLVTDPTTPLGLSYDIFSNNTTLVAANTLVKPNEAFITVINSIIEAITLISYLMSYKPETVLLDI